MLSLISCTRYLDKTHLLHLVHHAHLFSAQDIVAAVSLGEQLPKLVDGERWNISSSYIESAD